MIYRKSDYYEKIKKLTKNNFEIVMDFDKTITSDESLNSWKLFYDRGILTKEYDFERKSLYNLYRPIELDTEVDDAVKLVVMEDWVNKHLDLFKKYQLNKKRIIETFLIRI